MQIEFVRLYRFEDFDFESLYAGSEPDIYFNHFWLPEPGGRSKKELFRDSVVRAFDEKVSADGEAFFGFKVMIDGIDHVLNLGYIEADGTTYKVKWLLTKPYNESRSYLFTDNISSIRSQFYRDNNILTYKFDSKSSDIPVYKAMTSKTTINVISEVQEDANIVVTIQP